uniref:Uncharacterized protein n=1 Tax=Glossina palpalis gambiensis TaxID=67801 RepID=A0A1B0ATC3_9MUSC
MPYHSIPTDNPKYYAKYFILLASSFPLFRFLIIENKLESELADDNNEIGESSMHHCSYCALCQKFVMELWMGLIMLNG